MCHDLEHPGTTNAFQTNTQSELAMLHNDVHGAALPHYLPAVVAPAIGRSLRAAAARCRSMRLLRRAPRRAVLENHHCHVAFKLMKSVGLLDSIPPPERKVRLSAWPGPGVRVLEGL